MPPPVEVGLSIVPSSLRYLGWGKEQEVGGSRVSQMYRDPNRTPQQFYVKGPGNAPTKRLCFEHGQFIQQSFGLIITDTFFRGYPEDPVTVIAKASHSAKWDFPKGSREYGETHEMTAVRETEEEAYFNPGSLAIVPGVEFHTQYQVTNKDGSKMTKKLLLFPGFVKEAPFHREKYEYLLPESDAQRDVMSISMTELKRRTQLARSSPDHIQFSQGTRELLTQWIQFCQYVQAHNAWPDAMRRDIRSWGQVRSILQDSLHGLQTYNDWKPRLTEHRDWPDSMPTPLGDWVHKIHQTRKKNSSLNAQGSSESEENP